MGAVGGGVVRLGRSLRGGSHRGMMNRTGAWWGGGTFPWGMVEERSQEPFPAKHLNQHKSSYANQAGHSHSRLNQLPVAIAISHRNLCNLIVKSSQLYGTEGKLRKSQ